MPYRRYAAFVEAAMAANARDLENRQFKAALTANGGEIPDFERIRTGVLNVYLCKFFAEAVASDAEYEEMQAEAAVVEAEEAKAAAAKAKAAEKAELKEAQARMPTPRRTHPGQWAIPNILARSNWAGAALRGRSEERTLATSVGSGGPTIAFSGKPVTQAMLTLVLEIMRRCGEAGSNQLEVVPAQLLEGIGRARGQSAYRQLQGWLEDLQHSSICVEAVSGGKSQSIIPELEWRAIKGEPLALYKIKVAPLLIELWASQVVAFIEREKRLQCGHGAAAWLHPFVMSHKQHRYGYRVETLINAAGIGSARRCDDVKVLKAAIDVLIGIGVLKPGSGISPKDGLVYLDRY
jgi:hypothetical protein